jgi:hypothetical protein
MLQSHGVEFVMSSAGTGGWERPVTSSVYGPYLFYKSASYWKSLLSEYGPWVHIQTDSGLSYARCDDRRWWRRSHDNELFFTTVAMIKDESDHIMEFFMRYLNKVFLFEGKAY